MTEETKVSVAQSRITDEIFNALGLKPGQLPLFVWQTFLLEQ